ncbi:hypothetical protein UFOVP10_6 [uncultured Caudovirales phage]|uniref:Uncharacterized protein n=1 Tax=uncultured Caudovirales phage TaxID=2100421 RepID=A0A6J5KIN5_9CAUD|nr:hypothetical protein UFOVP10_6 [uncultured Caudovirales phage]
MEREALKLALEALEESKTNNDSMEFHERKNKAITAIKAALAQPAQEPAGMLHIERLDKWLDASLKERKSIPIGSYASAACPESCDGCKYLGRCTDADDTLLEQPAQTAQEPEAIWYVRENHTLKRLSADVNAALIEIEQEFKAGHTYGTLCSKRNGFVEVHASGEKTRMEFFADCKSTLEKWLPDTNQPQRKWNAALDEAAARIGEIKGFGQATQDSFAVFIKGLKK